MTRLKQFSLYCRFKYVWIFIFKYIEEIYKLIENVQIIDPKIITDNNIKNMEQFKNLLYILHIENIINSKSIDLMELIFELYLGSIISLETRLKHQTIKFKGIIENKE